MTARKKIIAANWKMNLAHQDVKSYADVLRVEVGVVNEIEIVLIPPFTAIPALAEALGNNSFARLGAQNMHWEKSGAFTGEISAAMLQALSVNYVVLGHSERRAQFGETDEIVNRKIKAALSSGLQPIFCVGETLTERDGKRVEEVLKRQIQEGLKEVSPRHFPDLVVAYEPLWAIGTGRTATPEQAQRTHAFIRSVVALVSDHSTAEQVRIQYGGSVKPENAEELLRQPDIDGALVGGASLDARSFAQIIRRAVAV